MQGDFWDIGERVRIYYWSAAIESKKFIVVSSIKSQIDRVDGRESDPDLERKV